MEFISILYWISVILGIWYVLKNQRLVNLFIVYSLLNISIIVFLKNQIEFYLLGTISNLIAFFIVIKFIKDKYDVETVFGLEGLVLKTPVFAFILRTVLIMIGGFPPFLSSNVIYYNLINSDVSFYSIISLILLLIFNFTLFMRLTVNVLFGKPSEDVVYKDVSKNITIISLFIIILNLYLGISYILNL